MPQTLLEGAERLFPSSLVFVGRIDNGPYCNPCCAQGMGFHWLVSGICLFLSLASGASVLPMTLIPTSVPSAVFGTRVFKYGVCRLVVRIP